MDITKLCVSCKGNLVVGEYADSGEEGEGLAWVDKDCWCTKTDYPGLNLVGTINLSDNVFYSHIILETFDAPEYAGLGAGAIAGINTLLSCGLVDLNEGKMGRVSLWIYFGAESTTVANLTALLT